MAIDPPSDVASPSTVDIRSVSTIETGSDDLVDVNLEDDDEISDFNDIEAGRPSNEDAMDINNDEASPVERSSREDMLKSLHAYYRDLGLTLREARRVRDFQLARSERARITQKPYLVSVFEINFHLCDIRADIRWAEDAAWRRENREPYIRWEDFEQARKQKKLKRPYLTYLILISHFVAMLYEFHLSHWTPAPMKQNAMIGPPSDVLFMAGAMKPSDMVTNGRWYQLVTATFLHSGLIHYLLNDLGIYTLASIIEMSHGVTCLALVYFLPAVAAFVLTALFNPGHIVVGASGGLFGLIGACLAEVIVNWKLMFLIFEDFPGMRKRCLQLSCAVSIVLEMTFQVGIGFFIPTVDNYAHVGGLVYGFLVAYVIFERLSLTFFGREAGCCAKWTSLAFRVVCAALLSWAIVYSSVKLSQSDGATVPYPVLNDYMNNPFDF